MNRAFLGFDNVVELYEEINRYIENYSDEFKQSNNYNKNRIGFKNLESIPRKQFLIGRDNKSMRIALYEDELKIGYVNMINSPLDGLVYTIHKIDKEWFVKSCGGTKAERKNESFTYEKLKAVIEEFENVLNR